MTPKTWSCFFMASKGLVGYGKRNGERWFRQLVIYEYMESRGWFRYVIQV